MFVLTGYEDGGGDLRDFDSAYRRYFPLIREKCRRMLDDNGEADDVAQDTFVRLWQAALDGAGDRRISSWIYRTSTRLAIDRMRERLRKRTPDQSVMLENLPGSSAGSDDVLSARRQLATLTRAVPAQELEIAMLSRIDRLSHAEIGEVLEISDRTVRRRLRELERRLHDLLKEEPR
jgi:RNA polymerase sigma-70 factor (ECF subfamily)